MNELSNLRPPDGAVKKYKRVGRGEGSHCGKTSGRGQKGSLARSGKQKGPGFEGGQMPLQRRLPKRGFSNYEARLTFLAISVGKLAAMGAGATVDLEAVKAAGLARGHDIRVKIVAGGDAAAQMTIKADRVSVAGGRPSRSKSERRDEFLVVTAAAAEAIQAAGGKIEVL